MSFNQSSLNRLETVHPELREIALMVETIKPHLIPPLGGGRTKEEQEDCFNRGASKKHYPHGKHCIGTEAGRELSDALDFAPLTLGGKVDWEQMVEFVYLGGLYMGIAEAMGVPLRYGYDWNQNGILSDETFIDAGHVERI
jgi:peptidoglycan L-alanyl-D-glutamate endopeptidase CwlK